MTEYYFQKRTIETQKTVPMAFTVSEELLSSKYSPTFTYTQTVTWTQSALLAFHNIQRTAHKGDGAPILELPYASLRAYLEIALEDVIRLASHTELSTKRLRKVKDDNFRPHPFAYISTDEGQSTKIQRTEKKLSSVLNQWIVRHLRPFAEKYNVSSSMIDRIEILIERNDIYQIRGSKSVALPWSQNPNTGTTQPQNKNGAPDKSAYRALVEHSARLIAGREIFSGLGPLRRVVLGYSSLGSNAAELMTEPISIGEDDRFSLVITLSVETVPALSQPLLKIDVSKRRWINALKASKFRSDNITGYMFSKDISDRVFSFRLSCQKKKIVEKEQQWEWIPNDSFSVLCQHFRLSPRNFIGQEIAARKADSDKCQFFLTYRHGIGEHSVGAGVPEIDKLKAFENIKKLLGSHGLIPFESHVKVPNRNKAPNKEFSREINLPTLINGMLQLSDQGSTEINPDYVRDLSDRELSALLKEKVNISAEQILGGINAFRIKRKRDDTTDDLKVLIEENQKALKRIYPEEKIRIIILYQEGSQDQASLLTQIIHRLWGQSLEVWESHLVKKTHGPRVDLPDYNQKAKQRSQARVKQWSKTSNSISKSGCRTFCLVLAEEFYQSSRGKPEYDDNINKPSTYRALAGDGGACVQFLLPMKRDRKGRFKLEDFTRNAQQALKDLLSAHSGRVDEIKGKVDKGLRKIPAESRPKEIIGITIVCKQQGRIKGRIQPTVLPIATRLDVESSRCDLRYAYDKNNNIEISRWEKLPDALSAISKISPVKLARNMNSLSERFMEFVNCVISESVNSGAQPLIIIDSINCSRLWHWLRDTDLNAENIEIETKNHMEQSWAGARIVRVRRDIPPSIIEKKERHLCLSDEKDNRTKEELNQHIPNLRLPSASSPTGLFRMTPLSAKGCMTYLSIAAVRQNFPRGLSCYRSIKAISKSTLTTLAGLKIGTLSMSDPHTGQCPTPNPLEIVVALRQEKDDPDHIAALVDSLRYVMGHYGEATILPAPLFFERVVRDYISDFTIEEISEDEQA